MKHTVESATGLARRAVYREDCPDESKHTHDRTEPLGYVAWHEWAERKGKTHVQIRCPTCRLYVIWKPKPRAAPDGSHR